MWCCIRIAACVNYDGDAQCSSMAEAGQCQTNPVYMVTRCRLACRACVELGLWTGLLCYLSYVLLLFIITTEWVERPWKCRVGLDIGISTIRSLQALYESAPNYMVHFKLMSTYITNSFEWSLYVLTCLLAYIFSGQLNVRNVQTSLSDCWPNEVTTPFTWASVQVCLSKNPRLKTRKLIKGSAQHYWTEYSIEPLSYVTVS